VLEKAAAAGSSPFPPESVSMAQRVMGAMPGVGHDAAIYARKPSLTRGPFTG
jgi:hypothetical protein